MNRFVYLKELKNFIKSFVSWTLGLSFYLLAGMSKYQGYAASGESLNDIFKGFPKEFMAFFGGTEMDFTQAGDFYAIAIMYIGVMLGIHAVLLGSRIIGKEETEKTAEFLYSKPIPRLKVWFSKVLAGLTNLVVLNVVMTLLSLPIVALFNEGPSINDSILFLAPSLLLIQIFFFALSVFLASVLKKPKRSGAISGAILLITFVMSAMVDISNQFELLKYITPFKFFDPKIVHIENSYNFIYVIAAIGFSIAVLIVGRVVYGRRDLNV